MELILFTKTIEHPACRHLMYALYQMSVPFRVITGRHALQDVMIKMRTDEALFVFLLLDVEDMEILNNLRPQIQDRRIITILPDDSAHFRSIGCSMLPRFQALMSDDLSIVAEVAARIVNIEIKADKNRFEGTDKVYVPFLNTKDVRKYFND